MSRSLRFDFVGALHHVTSRGDRKEPIYLDDLDRIRWLSIFSEVCGRFNWICHTYCLMGNHFHVVVETLEATLSKGMRHLNGVYAQAFNRRHELVGHLFQGRFKSILIEKEAYLLELARYVPLNPVRARLSKEPGEWQWSNYQQTIGAVPAPKWLETDWLLSQFSSDEERARTLFIDFVAAGVGRSSIWDELGEEAILGSDEYVDYISDRFPPAENSQAAPRSRLRDGSMIPDPIGLVGQQRDESMAKAYLRGGYTLKAIAERFGVHLSTVSRVVKKYRTSQSG
jgi:REP element-mobilizing transposase RayT